MENGHQQLEDVNVLPLIDLDDNRPFELEASSQAVTPGPGEASSQTAPLGDLLQLELGAPYQGASGPFVVDQAAIGSSSSITDKPVHAHKNLDELLAPILESMYDKKPANLKHAEEEEKERANVKGRKVNEVTIVVLGLAKSGKTTLVTELSKATSKLKIKYNFLDPCSGNFSEEDIIKELSYSDQVILVVDPMKEFKTDYPNKNFRGYGFLTYHLGFKNNRLTQQELQVNLLSFPREEYRCLKNNIHNRLTQQEILRLLWLNFLPFRRA